MNKKYIYGGVALLVIGGGIAFYFYNKNKKSSISNKSTSKTPLTDNVEEIDTTTKGYVKLNGAIKKWKEFLKTYAKSGLVLKDMSTGNDTSKEATETAYIFATKEITSIEDGIAKDSSISATQKILLKDMADDYFNDYLPLYFDKARYNMYSTWYKDKVGKMTLVDYYKD
jgi:hypothetical protein